MEEEGAEVSELPDASSTAASIDVPHDVQKRFPLGILAPQTGHSFVVSIISPSKFLCGLSLGTHESYIKMYSLRKFVVPTRSS